MNTFILTILVVLLLSGCPGRPPYVPIPHGGTEQGAAGLRIRPIGFFYFSTKKDSITYDISFKFTNESNSTMRLDMSGSELITPAGTLPMLDQIAIGGLPVDLPMPLYSKSDTVVIFRFKREKSFLRTPCK